MSRRTRSSMLVAGLVLAATALLSAGALKGTLTYYRTPSEVLADPSAAHQRVRLGGQVVPGSLRRDGTRTLFRLAADGRAIAVVQRGAPPETFREGQNAVVEGTLDADRVFHADTVLVRHDNEYRAARTPGHPR